MLDNAIDAGGEEASGKGVLFACKGIVASAFVNGETDIAVTDDGFSLASLFDSTRVHWADVTALKYEDYAVYVQTRAGAYVLSKIGLNGEPLYINMLASYGAKVRKCLFASGSPLIKAKGNVAANGPQTTGVPVEVYEDCILSLPPDLSARRVPLCFLNGFKDQDYVLNVSAVDGTETRYSMLGYEHGPASKAIQDSVKSLRAKLIGQITEIDPTLTDAQATQLSRLMPGGLAAQMGVIRGVAPSFAAALEAKISKSRAAETYKVFRELFGADQICVGFRANDKSFAFGSQGGDMPDSTGAGAGAAAISKAFGGFMSESDSAKDDADQSEPDKYMLLLVAPAPSGKACALEFAGAKDEAAATFIYRFEGTWADFRIKLGIALEAIAWRREIIRYTDEELRKPENIDYLMTNDRNEALRFVRASFAGRAIHRTMDSWKKQMTNLLGM